MSKTKHNYNLKLKVAIIRKFGRSIDASIATGITEMRLSSFITGRAVPKDEEIERLEKCLDLNRTSLGLCGDLEEKLI